MIIRPVDLPSLRDETAEWVLRNGPELYERAINDGRQWVKPIASPTRGAGILSSAEIRRLKEADLFFVSSEMTDLAVAAGASLPEFSLMPEDVPSPCGFILFEKPIAAVDYAQYYENEGKTPIVAATWSPWTGNNSAWVHGGIWITWYGDRDGALENAVARGIFNQRQADQARTGVGRLLLDNESQCPFSPDPIPGSEVQDGLGVWLAVLKAAWLLMSQPVASVNDAVFDRAARRRLQREGKEPPRVRVITLRRPRHADYGQSDR